MQTKLLDFISALRENNVRVSLAESQDALNAVLSSPDLVLNRDIFKQALQCTLIKNVADTDTFNLLFDFFFLQRNLKYADFIREIKEKELRAQRQAIRIVVAPPVHRGEGDSNGDGQKDASETDHLHELLKEVESEGSLHSLTKSLITGNAAHWENLVDEKVSLLMPKWAQKPLRRKATYEKHILESFDWFEIDSELDNIYYQAAMFASLTPLDMGREFSPAEPSCPCLTGLTDDFVLRKGMDVESLINSVEAHKKQF